jgi:hypothetical protein
LYLKLEKLIMFKIAMPPTPVIHRPDTLLEMLYGSSLEGSGNRVSNTGIHLDIAE